MASADNRHAVAVEMRPRAFAASLLVQCARHVALQIRAGRVAISGMGDDPQAPWGAIKDLGVCREFGTFGIEAFLEPRAILE
jgi:aldehyde dehydrogenase (NAD+)